MVLGKIFTYANNPRVARARIAARFNGEDFEEVIIDLSKGEHKGKGFGQVPLLETANGVQIFESSAIAYYGASCKPNSQLLGANNEENALIHQWILFAENEIHGPTKFIYGNIFGRFPYNAEQWKASFAKLETTMSFLNEVLLTKTYLVGESLTLADIVVITALYGIYKMLLGSEEYLKYKNIFRYYNTFIQQPIFADVLAKHPFLEKTVEPNKALNAKPKADKPKADKPKADKPKAEPKEEAEEDYSDPKPQGKNPLDLLPPTSMVLDEWKRTYSNNDTRPVAVDWFWKNFDPTGYSIYKVCYKYNNELTMTFMSNNLVGGFYQRLERARKYAFGSLVVLGKDNDNRIQGYFVFRGDGVPFEVTDAADYESYDFVKVDSSDAKVREEFNSYIAWDEQIEGLPFCDGKIFK